MKKILIGCFFVVSLFALQQAFAQQEGAENCIELDGQKICFPQQAPQQEEQERKENLYAVNPNLISKVESKIKRYTKQNKWDQVTLWNEILDALYGENVMNTYHYALREAQSTKRKKKSRKLWNQIADALYAVQSLQLTEYNRYDFDSDLLAVLIRKMSLSKTMEEERPWRNVLLALSGQLTGLGGTVEVLKHFVKPNQRPPEWEQLIGALEKYTLESYGEEPFLADVRPNNAKQYDIYDAETEEKIASISIDANDETVGIIRGGQGEYHTSDGRTEWALDFAKGAEGDEGYLSYGYWANSQVPVGREDDNFNERRAVVFYHGDNPATDISSVKGKAIYQGKTVGVWKYNAPASHEINEFTGEVGLIANFEKNTIDGLITGLNNSLPERTLPGQIRLEPAELSSNGQFNGQASSPVNVGSGEWSGRFYNHGNSTDAPGQVGGSYSFLTGVGEKGIQMEGAFGATLWEQPIDTGQEQ